MEFVAKLLFLNRSLTVSILASTSFLLIFFLFVVQLCLLKTMTMPPSQTLLLILEGYSCQLRTFIYSGLPCSSWPMYFYVNDLTQLVLLYFSKWLPHQELQLTMSHLTSNLFIIFDWNKANRVFLKVSKPLFILITNLSKYFASLLH